MRSRERPLRTPAKSATSLHLSRPAAGSRTPRACSVRHAPAVEEAFVVSSGGLRSPPPLLSAYTALRGYSADAEELEVQLTDAAGGAGTSRVYAEDLEVFSPRRHRECQEERQWRLNRRLGRGVLDEAPVGSR